MELASAIDRPSFPVADALIHQPVFRIAHLQDLRRSLDVGADDGVPDSLKGHRRGYRDRLSVDHDISRKPENPKTESDSVKADETRLRAWASCVTSRAPPRVMRLCSPMQSEHQCRRKSC